MNEQAGTDWVSKEFGVLGFNSNPGGWEVLPINGLMGMCRWMGSYFHDWIDYNGVSFSTKFPSELLEWGRKLSGFWG